jgi:hypothetical protein
MGIPSSGIAFDHPPKPIAENPVPSDSTVYPSRSGTRGSPSTTTPSTVSPKISPGSRAYQASVSQRVKMLEQFLAPSCTPRNPDIFLVCSAILRDLQGTTRSFSGTLLDVGCGHMPYKSLVLAPPSRATRYVGLDLESSTYEAKPDHPLGWESDSATRECGGLRFGNRGL